MTLPRLLVLAATVTLSWHAPAFHTLTPGSCPDTTGNGTAIVVPETCTVYRQTQSQRWRDSSAVMVKSAASWSRNWPVVRAEAEPVIAGWLVAMPAAACSLSVADAPGWFYFVRAKTSVECRCNSNEVWR